MKRVLLALLLAACSSTRPPEPRDRALDNYAAAARDAYDQGNAALAADLYARALDRARLGDADVDVANQAYNRALCLMEIGSLDAARTLMKESRSAFARAGLDDADAALAEAQLCYMAQDVEGARAAARALLARELPAALRAEALVLLGEIACAEGDAAEGRRALSLATAIRLDPRSDQLALSHRNRLAGCIAMLDKDFARAARSCDEEASWAREARAYGAMAKALERAGDAYLAAGDPVVAAERYYRAGRSRLAAGDKEGARGPAKQALALAGPDLRPLAEALEGDVEGMR